MTPGREHEPTVAAGDIARLAGVGRAAVSNWRRRFADFPEPVSGSAVSPLFRLADVERWLAAHDRSAPVPPVELAWQAIRAESDDMELGDAVAAAGAVLLGSTDDPGLSAETLAQLREAAVGSGRDTVHEYVVGRFLEVRARRLAIVPDPLSRVIARIGAVEGRRVLDPACGTGGLLRAAAEAGAAEATGQERDPVAARIAGHRLRLAPGTTGDVAIGDALRDGVDPGGTADVVVCVPPFADRNWGHDELAGDPRWIHGLPPRGESELAWIQHCLSRVDTGGRVLVQVPTGVAFRRAGRRIRNALLRAGAVDAVIGLPRDSGVPTDLWVLHRPGPGDPPPSRVLIGVAGSYDEVAEIWSQHLAGATDATARAVGVLELLDEDVDLSPERHLRAEPDPVDHADAAERYRQAVATLPAVPDLRPVEPVAAVASTTLAELIKSGVVSVLQAPLGQTTGRDGPGTVPVLTVRDVRAHRRPTGRTSASIAGTVALQVGDVVVPVPAVQGAGALVVTDSGAVLGPRTQALRTDPARLDPHYLAGILRAASAGGMRTTGRSDVRRVTVPTVPIERQRELGEAFHRLVRLETGLREVRAAGTELVRGAVQGLGAGTLEPRP